MEFSNLPLILIRGAGDLASGVALRLFRSGFGIVMTEIAAPLSVRRLASFSEAVFEGRTVVEGVSAMRCEDVPSVIPVIRSGQIAVLVDPLAHCRNALPFLAAVEGRMLKKQISDPVFPQLLTLGLGPGFTAGLNCHAAVETNRGGDMGRVIRQGSTQEDTKEPEMVLGVRNERVLRAPASGTLITYSNIGRLVEKGDLLAEIQGTTLIVPFRAVVRGLLRNGTEVEKGMKIGDLDPRCDPALCVKVSDKALAAGGGVLEALLSNDDIRQALGRSV